MQHVSDRPSCPRGIFFPCFPMDAIIIRKFYLGHQKPAKVAMLTSACEAFSSILFFPLAWVHCYNPLLPCTDYLQTPPPFLFGLLREIILKETGADDLLRSEFFGPSSGHLAESRDFSIVDLDTGAEPRGRWRFFECCLYFVDQ